MTQALDERLLDRTHAVTPTPPGPRLRPTAARLRLALAGSFGRSFARSLARLFARSFAVSRALSRALTLAFATACLGGCSILGLPSIAGDDKAVVKPPVPIISEPGRRVVRVGLDQAGARIELGIAQQLQVRLLTRVSATPEWSLVGHVPGVVDVQGPKFEPDAHSNTSGDVEGDTVWHIRPTAAGVVTLRFEYRRPRNTAPAVQVVTFDVAVR